MDICRSCEPRQETCIFYWVPCPYTAPAEHFITPPSAQDDAESEKPPRTQGPTSSFNEPSFADAPSDESCNSKGKRNGETHITQIQNGGMKKNQNVVLQERVGAWPIGYSGSTHPKWVCRSKAEQEEKRENNEHHRHGPCNEWVVQFFAVSPHHGYTRQRERQHP
ncbi:unannotated protein [freshwater metagenome]|uniref:Unannotated protein n=1 Tax=freshwater metagenome TaxID=449393 RepID=A0A6J7RRX5_9ZZZZ